MDPIAHRLRPRRLADVVGQEHLLADGGRLTDWIAAGRIPSLVLAGPPGCGKTTIARLIADEIGVAFMQMDATNEGKTAIRDRLLEAVSERAKNGGRSPILFVDEIHRATRVQQDALIAAVESGQVAIVGATTEPPATALSPALLSRMAVVRLRPIDEAAMRAILARGVTQLAEDGTALTIDDSGERNLIGYAAGDARRAIGILEDAAAIAARAPGATSPLLIDSTVVVRAAGAREIGYDRSGVISALIKSIRGGDREAALYWTAVALEGGEDPRHIGRRLVIAAGEEIGAADPAALPIAVATLTAIEQIGMPEAHYPIAACVAYIATAARDWSAGADLHHARATVERAGARAVPGHLRPQAKTYRHPVDGEAASQAYLPETARADLRSGR